MIDEYEKEIGAVSCASNDVTVTLLDYPDTDDDNIEMHIWDGSAWAGMHATLTPTQATQLITLLSKAIKEIEEKT